MGGGGEKGTANLQVAVAFYTYCLMRTRVSSECHGRHARVHAIALGHSTRVRR